MFGMGKRPLRVVLYTSLVLGLVAGFGTPAEAADEEQACLRYLVCSQAGDLCTGGTCTLNVPGYCCPTQGAPCIGPP